MGREREREREKVKEVNTRVRVKIIESEYPVFPALLSNAKNSRSLPHIHVKLGQSSGISAVRIEIGDLRWKRNTTSP